MIFVDSSAIYALLDGDDKHHGRCAEEFVRLQDEVRLFTHDAVVVESVALIQRRLGPQAIRNFALDLLPALHVSYLGRRLHELAMAAYLTDLTTRRSVSLVDHLSFAFMNDTRITRAFTTDRDFERLGFEVVP